MCNIYEKIPPTTLKKLDLEKLTSNEPFYMPDFPYTVLLINIGMNFCIKLPDSCSYSLPKKDYFVLPLCSTG